MPELTADSRIIVTLASAFGIVPTLILAGWSAAVLAQRYVTKEELKEVLSTIDQHFARIETKMDKAIDRFFESDHTR